MALAFSTMKKSLTDASIEREQRWIVLSTTCIMIIRINPPDVDVSKSVLCCPLHQHLMGIVSFMNASAEPGANLLHLGT